VTTAAYLQVPVDETLEGKVDSSYRYAAAGAALGILFGVVVAVATGNTLGPVASHDAGTANASAQSAMVSTPAAPVAQPSAPQSQADSKPSDSSIVPSVYAAMIEAPVTPAPAAAPVHHATHRVVRKNLSDQQTLQDVPAALATAIVPPVSEAVSPEDTAKSFVFMIEGDVTVADFDASTGTIETNDGKSFVIDKTVGDASSMSWGDYSGNVHYRCDQGGNCTLMGNGISVPNVRLTT